MKWVVAHLWLFWTFWLLGLGVGYFAIFETIALAEGGETFSHFMVRISMAWPPLIAVWGGLFVGLTVHFYWVWNNPIAKLGGGG